VVKLRFDRALTRFENLERPGRPGLVGAGVDD
jgi:hypothetical protein